MWDTGYFKYVYEQSMKEPLTLYTRNTHIN